MTRILALVVLTALLTGCPKRDTEAPAPRAAVIYRDAVTGCEYVSAGGNGITERTAADGMTHAGCKGVQP